MVDQEFIEVLNDCINRLAGGQSIEECLRQHPQFADRLKPMLQTGTLLYHTGIDSTEIHDAQKRSRLRLQQHQQRKRFSSNVRRIVASGVIAAALVVGMFGVIGQTALPGDSLYGVKLFTENLRGAIDPAYSASAERRMDEIRQLLALHRIEEVTFDGTVQAKNGTVWRIAGLDVEVSPSVSSAGIGDQVTVKGSTTADGVLIAHEIWLLVALQKPTVTVTPGSTAMPTLTPLPPTATVTATFTLTPSPTRTRLPAKPASPTIRPTIAVSPMPATHVPTNGPANTPSGNPHDDPPSDSKPPSDS